jgi:hypothetical protein
MSSKPNLPRWLKPANRVIMFLNRLGLAIGTQHVLSIPGRKTGVMRSTPVSLLTVDGQRYIATVGDTEWVRNARVAGWALLARGRQQERVAMVELPAEQRGPILREFPRQVPGGVQFFTMTLGIGNDPEAFAAAAPQCPVFRVDPLASNEQPVTNDARERKT